jgi:hypothetical protein
VIKGRLGLSGVQGKELVKELVDSSALTPSRFKETAQDAVVFQARGRTGAMDHVAHEHHRAHTLFGLAVGWRHLPVTKAGEEVLLFLAPEPLAKGLGLGVV